MKTIKINIDNDNKPIVEGFENIGHSLFEAQYERSFEAIESILYSQDEDKRNTQEPTGDVESSNNIIVFDGDRGTGKTSCMLSVAKMLTGDRDKLANDKLKMVSVKSFEKMQMLEPSFFDAEHNVLSLVVSRLYQEFNKNTNRHRWSSSERQNLLSLFVDIQNQLKCLFHKDVDVDALEYLVNLSAAVSLREDIHKLIGLYLNGKCDKLLILIDDIDLNQKQACSMVEELRKYLVQDNCIVLVSVKIAQLQGILYREYSKEYKSITGEEEAEIKDRVDRYLSKLFPQSQRIHMPEPKDYLDYNVVIESQRTFDYKIECQVIRDVIPELIFAKTRYLFYNTKKVTSYIVPRNLRNIRQILKLLMELHNYSDKESSTEINKNIFKHYLFTDWIEQNITSEYQTFAKNLTRHTFLPEINYVVVSFLYTLIIDRINSQKSDENDNLFNANNSYYNISLGDVFSAIRLVESVDLKLGIKELLFFIKAYYGIILYESYDSVTPNTNKDKDNKDTKFYIQRKELGLTRNDYQSILAGSVFNSEIESFQMKKALAVIKIYDGDLISLAEKIDKNEAPKGRFLLCRLMEFLMLFIGRRESEDTGDKYRLSTYLSYDSFVPILYSPFIASIGSFFYNITCYQHAIDRFRQFSELKSFFDFYDKEEGSLYQDIKEIAKEKRTKTYKDDDSKIMSLCCFRNMEVLEDFYDSIKDADFNIYSNVVGALTAFFEKAASYKIKTYDRYESNGIQTPYDIEFNYLNLFVELLKNDVVKEEAKKILKFNEPAKKPIGDTSENGYTTELGGTIAQTEE